MSVGVRRSALEPKQERSQATRQKLLDAAVDCLLEEGYASLRTGKVADRAGVSRGAQQHHFPHKAVLVSEAVDHLYRRQDEWIVKEAQAIGSGAARVGRVLDLLWESYSGKLYAASLELALAAEHDAELRKIVRALQRKQDAGTVAWSRDVFGSPVADHPEFEQRLALTLSTIRGIAALLPFGYSRRAVDRQWAFARPRLAALMTEGVAGS